MKKLKLVTLYEKLEFIIFIFNIILLFFTIIMSLLYIGLIIYMLLNELTNNVLEYIIYLIVCVFIFVNSFYYKRFMEIRKKYFKILFEKRS